MRKLILSLVVMVLAQEGFGDVVKGKTLVRCENKDNAKIVYRIIRGSVQNLRVTREAGEEVDGTELNHEMLYLTKNGTGTSIGVIRLVNYASTDAFTTGVTRSGFALIVVDAKGPSTEKKTGKGSIVINFFQGSPVSELNTDGLTSNYECTVSPDA